jgi:hypothetical protein
MGIDMPAKSKAAKAGAETAPAETVKWLYIYHPETGRRYSVRPDTFTAEDGYQSQGYVVEYTDTGEPWGEFQPAGVPEPEDGGGEDMLQTPAAVLSGETPTEPEP